MANDLTPTTGLPRRRPTSPDLSPDLTRLLDDDALSPDESCRQIGQYLAIREEARAALPALKAVAEWKAGEDGVRAVVSKRFALYPQPQRTEGEWAAWWDDYIDVLSDVPLACLEAAMRAWISRPGTEFMPKPGQLRDLAYTTVSKSLRRYQRAKRALDQIDRPAALTPAYPDGVAVDTAAEIKRMMEEFKAKSAIPSTPKPPLPSISGKPDGGGLTPEMRALIARRSMESF